MLGAEKITCTKNLFDVLQKPQVKVLYNTIISMTADLN